MESIAHCNLPRIMISMELRFWWKTLDNIASTILRQQTKLLMENSTLSLIKRTKIFILSTLPGLIKCAEAALQKLAQRTLHRVLNWTFLNLKSALRVLLREIRCLWTITQSSKTMLMNGSCWALTSRPPWSSTIVHSEEDWPPTMFLKPFAHPLITSQNSAESGRKWKVSLSLVVSQRA